MVRPRSPTTGTSQHTFPSSSSARATSDARPTASRKVHKASKTGQTARRFHPTSREEALAGVTVGAVCPAGIPRVDTIQDGVKIRSVIVNKEMHCDRDDDQARKNTMKNDNRKNINVLLIGALKTYSLE